VLAGQNPEKRKKEPVQVSYLPEQQESLIQAGNKVQGSWYSRTPDAGRNNPVQPTGAFFTRMETRTTANEFQIPEEYQVPATYYVYKNPDGTEFASVRKPANLGSAPKK